MWTSDQMVLFGCHMHYLGRYIYIWQVLPNKKKNNYITSMFTF